MVAKSLGCLGAHGFSFFNVSSRRCSLFLRRASFILARCSGVGDHIRTCMAFVIASLWAFERGFPMRASRMCWTCSPDPPMQGDRRIPESSAEGNGDSIMVVLKKVPCPAFGRGGLCRLACRSPWGPCAVVAGVPACGLPGRWRGTEIEGPPPMVEAGEGTNPRRAGPGNPGCPDSMNPCCGDSR